jgi:hypothetical protein
MFFDWMNEWIEAEAEAEAYCRQPAGTLNPGTGPRWDPWSLRGSLYRG